MFKYGTDKSKDDHGYVNVYSNLFPFSTRGNVKYVLELGVSMGQSIQVWHEYFTNATIIGLDNEVFNEVKSNLMPLKRAKYIPCNIFDRADVQSKLSDLPERSVDLIVEDSTHRRRDQEMALQLFWRFLKPGGYFVIEDVNPWANGFDFEEDPNRLEQFTQEVLKSNLAFIADTAVAHRAWDQWLKVNDLPFRRVALRQHNSHLLVIQKRSSKANRGRKPTHS